MNTDRCQLCNARLRAIRIRNGKYDGQPEDMTACDHPHDDDWCTLGTLPVPDDLQWLVTGASPHHRSQRDQSRPRDCVGRRGLPGVAGQRHGFGQVQGEGAAMTEIINYAPGWQLRIYPVSDDCWCATWYKDSVGDQIPATFYSDGGWNARFMQTGPRFYDEDRRAAIWHAVNWHHDNRCSRPIDEVPAMWFNDFSDWRWR
jgi:hypothetical protein